MVNSPASAPRPILETIHRADMVADMIADTVVNMEEEKVADIGTNMVADMEVDKVPQDF